MGRSKRKRKLALSSSSSSQQVAPVMVTPTPLAPKQRLCPNGNRHFHQKKNQKKQQQQQQLLHNGNANSTRFWVEDCPETTTTRGGGKAEVSSASSSSDEAAAAATDDPNVNVIDVLITRVELEDDYRCQNQHRAADSWSAAVDDDTASDIRAMVAHSDSPPHEEAVDIHTSETSPVVVVEASETLEEASGDDKIIIFSRPGAPEHKAGPTKAHAKEPEADAIMEQGEPQQGGVVESRYSIRIRRAASAKRPRVKGNYFPQENFKPLPHGDCGDGIVNPHSNDEVADKYWSQRRRLFTKFDMGIKLDKESWYSVTPEVIAHHIANRITASNTSSIDFSSSETESSSFSSDDDSSDDESVVDEDGVIDVTKKSKGMIIIDPFSGCGGNCIAFGLSDKVSKVVCVDLDRNKLEYAANNARIYGIPAHKMIYIHGEACEILSMYQNGKLLNKRPNIEPEKKLEDRYAVGGAELLPPRIDAIFMSPPWGGMDYLSAGKRNYTLDCIKLESSIDPDSSTVDGSRLLQLTMTAAGPTRPIAIFLPRNLNGRCLAASAHATGCYDHGSPIVLEQNNVNGKLKAVTAYFNL